MAGNPFVRLREALTVYKNTFYAKVREITGKLTPRQRILILVLAFGTFVVVDIVYIVNGFSGDSSKSLDIEHVKGVEINNINPINNDTIPEYAPTE